MRRWLLAGFALTMCGAMLWASSPADFSGTWVLDKAKSEGLPPNLQDAEAITWIITSDDKILKLEVQGGRAPQVENYRVDGKDNVEDVTGRITGKATRKLMSMGDGKMLELKSVFSGDFNGNAVTITTLRHLELGSEGKVLKVHQESETPRGKTESKLVFARK